MRFLDVRATYTDLKAEIDSAVLAVLDSGQYIGGPVVEAFEQQFAEYCGARHCIGVGNGLDAIAIILEALGIGAGDEVIVPTHTFIATWLAVHRVGATLVPVDVDARSMNLTAAVVEPAITARTRAVLAVHLYGALADMESLPALCRARGLHLVEDAAQAHGARLGGHRAGRFGTAAAFSFYPGKNLGAFGDAGAITTDDDTLAAACRMIGNYGSAVKYRHDAIGGNSRLDPVQAAVLSAKLPHLDAWNARRREIAGHYAAALAGLDGIVLPDPTLGAAHVWHLYVLRCQSGRDNFVGTVNAAGVPTMFHYPFPNHRTGAFSGAFGDRSFPVSERIAETAVSLPIGPHMTDGEVGAVIEAARAGAFACRA
jgi:dTDP-3-amino-3,4,6-trideoxy-alpha-D-glucose transaminase